VPRALVFGGSGQIGAACLTTLQAAGFETVATSRRVDEDRGLIGYDPLTPGARLPAGEPFDAVVWAQGSNLNDSIADFNTERHRELYDANVLYIALSLQALVQAKQLSHPARLCVISSIWQNVARRNKFSYMVTKSALQGLVRSAAVDLAPDGILINAVLPGALDTPMTRQNLTDDQIGRLAALTPFGRLANIDDVASLAVFLCSTSNSSITGQFVSVDLGFEHARLV
jgi:3-oxoacyl-[acyl-carrier protein] reductase